MTLCISKNYNTESFPEYPHLTLEHKIDLFEDRIFGWHLKIAECMITINEDENSKYSKIMAHSGFAVLSVVFNYFELIGKYKNPNVVGSKKLFCLGFEDVYPEYKSTKCAENLYKEGRCGMYHSGITGKGIVISGGYKKTIIYDDKKNLICINPHFLVRDLIKHFSIYINELRSSKANDLLIKNFDKAKGQKNE